MWAIIMVIGLGAGLFWVRNFYNRSPGTVPSGNQSQSADTNMSADQNNGASAPARQDVNPQNPYGFQSPLDRAGERVTKKPFGIFITPQNSPVQPEKFRGYHTGADFEIFPEELNLDVPVRAVCPGRLKVKKYADGYGGVVVESCSLDGQLITVVYGHLRLASVDLAVGSDLKAGDVIGVLGNAYSSETSGERKHLHLGFHKGSGMNILGYVQNQSELSGWIDPCLYVCHN